MGYEKYFFSHARTAFKYGLKSFNLSEDDKILVPKYICASIIKPLEILKIKPIFYNLKKDFNPDWEHINLLFDKKIKAILAVHYFGQPQNLDKFLDFGIKKSVLVIEDNAHGWGARFKGKYLGEIGDFGFSSPRKIIDIKSGAFLSTKNILNLDTVNLKKNKNFLNIWKYKNHLKQLIKSKPNIFKLIRSQPKYWELDAFKEMDIVDAYADKFSYEKILNTDLDKLREKRRFIYKIWENFIKEKTELELVFPQLNIDASPYLLPAYTKSFQESKKYFDWGWINGFQISSWPTLPDEIKNDRKIQLIWGKLICFPINTSINANKLKTKLDLVSKGEFLNEN